MATLIFKTVKNKWKIVITDYIDYPVLHITTTNTSIFSRNFSVVLDASLAEYDGSTIALLLKRIKG